MTHETQDEIPSPAQIAAAWRRELPGARTESIEILTPLWRVAKLLTDERQRTLQRLGIDESTLDLLSTLRRSGPPYQLTTRQIAARSLVTAGAISQRLTRAESAGLITREPTAASRRGVLVTLTPEGHRLTERVVPALLEHETALTDRLPASERAVLTAALTTLAAALRSAGPA
ncbi:MarR family winged helix-turn-helix transcriptional regulator [Nocardia sputorum]|uniref:MarR family transcriptional regulator n=1 Tax=Nocardia sputorum TaxID=2984338 RepID=A0ABM8CX30_9NOCA|nr:MarR family transcriptional regulator [Nocardia sputorum]BDT90915.1 MarR family transcriptional regulator [Nocardia sputorum]BDT99547.1 MarR family transcriptional regulator [Nocardia sputorum]